MTLHRTLRDLMIFGAAALTLASSGLTRPVQAAPSGLPTFGSVDIHEKLQTQSSKKAKFDADLHALADRLDGAFKQQAASIMLTKAEQTELGGLLSKANPTDADRARSAVLQAESNKAAQELTDLQQGKTSPADTARIAALTTQYETGKAALQEVGDSYQAQLKALSDKDNIDFTQSVKEAITAVAQQKGLSVVFTSDIAVYTTNDITDDVVKRINK